MSWGRGRTGRGGGSTPWSREKSHLKSVTRESPKSGGRGGPKERRFTWAGNIIVSTKGGLKGKNSLGGSLRNHKKIGESRGGNDRVDKTLYTPAEWKKKKRVWLLGGTGPSRCKGRGRVPSTGEKKKRCRRWGKTPSENRYNAPMEKEKRKERYYHPNSWILIGGEKRYQRREIHKGRYSSWGKKNEFHEKASAGEKKQKKFQCRPIRLPKGDQPMGGGGEKKKNQVGS